MSMLESDCTVDRVYDQRTTCHRLLHPFQPFCIPLSHPSILLLQKPRVRLDVLAVIDPMQQAAVILMTGPSTVEGSLEAEAVGSSALKPRWVRGITKAVCPFHPGRLVFESIQNDDKVFDWITVGIGCVMSCKTLMESVIDQICVLELRQISPLGMTHICQEFLKSFRVGVREIRGKVDMHVRKCNWHSLPKDGTAGVMCSLFISAFATKAFHNTSLDIRVDCPTSGGEDAVEMARLRGEGTWKLLAEALLTAKFHSLPKNSTSVTFSQDFQAHLFKHISSRLIIHEHSPLNFEESPLLLWSCFTRGFSIDFNRNFSSHRQIEQRQTIIETLHDISTGASTKIAIEHAADTSEIRRNAALDNARDRKARCVSRRGITNDFLAANTQSTVACCHLFKQSTLELLILSCVVDSSISRKKTSSLQSRIAFSRRSLTRTAALPLGEVGLLFKDEVCETTPDGSRRERRVVPILLDSCIKWIKAVMRAEVASM
ncbi:hypothetical protein KCV05_g45, partial [Aureobasidium melanogenum]